MLRCCWWFAIWGFGGRFVVLGIWLHCKFALFILLSVLGLIPLFLITMVCVFLVVLDFVCVGGLVGKYCFVIVIV